MINCELFYLERCFAVENLFQYMKDMAELIEQRLLLYIQQNNNLNLKEILIILGKNKEDILSDQNSFIEFKKNLDKKKAVLFEKSNHHPMLLLLAFFSMNEFDEHCLILSLLPYINNKYRKIIPYLQSASHIYFTLQTAMNIFCGEYTIENKISYMLEFEEKTDGFLFEKNSSDDITQKPIILKRQLIDFLFREIKREKEFYKIFLPETPLDSIVFCQNLQKSLTKILNDNGCWNKILYFYGKEKYGKWFQIKSAAKKLNRSAIKYQCTTYSEEEIYSIFTEAILKMAILYIFDYNKFNEKEIQFILNLYIKHCSHIFPLILGCENQTEAVHCPVSCEYFEIQINEPDDSSKKAFWMHILGEKTGEETICSDNFIRCFPFDCKKLKQAVYEARQKSIIENEGILTKSVLESCCRNYGLYHMNKYAVSIPISYTWEDLILEERSKKEIRQACNQIKFYDIVYNKWDFKVPYGRGVRLLFEGPPGTGKTMAAQVIANETELELYRVDLSSILSKYIGETEKQLKTIFEEAKGQNILLFFDEMDALFGKRSSVKNSNDRYSNMQIAFLLQQIEEYEGAIVFATNLLKNVDEAFIRRIQFIIHFSIPNELHRIKIWKNMFPKKAPIEKDIDYEYLGKQFSLSGGNIRNIVLLAAFSAAAEGTSISMRHIIISVCQEIAKQGRVVLKEDLGKYSYLWEEL